VPQQKFTDDAASPQGFGNWHESSTRVRLKRRDDQRRSTRVQNRIRRAAATYDIQRSAQRPESSDRQRERAAPRRTGRERNSSMRSVLPQQLDLRSRQRVNLECAGLETIEASIYPPCELQLVAGPGDQERMLTEPGRAQRAIPEAHIFDQPGLNLLADGRRATTVELGQDGAVPFPHGSHLGANEDDVIASARRPPAELGVMFSHQQAIDLEAIRASFYPLAFTHPAGLPSKTRRGELQPC